jgi:hypothetical protein
MILYEQAQAVLAQDPLPDDAPAQLDALADKANGEEALFIGQLSEALYQLATPEQLDAWAVAP